MNNILLVIRYLNPLEPYKLIWCNFVLGLSFWVDPAAIKFLFFQRIENQYQYIFVAGSHLFLQLNSRLITLGEVMLFIYLISIYISDRSSNFNWIETVSRKFCFVLLKFYIILGNIIVLDGFLLNFFYNDMNLWNIITFKDNFWLALFPFLGGVLILIYCYGESCIKLNTNRIA